jgi:hypothetical protein
MTKESLMLEVFEVCRLPEQFFLKSALWEKTNAHKKASLGLLLQKYQARKASHEVRMYLYKEYKKRFLLPDSKKPVTWKEIQAGLEHITAHVYEGKNFKLFIIYVTLVFLVSKSWVKST